MKTNYQVPTEFGPEVRFELVPVPQPEFGSVLEARFELLKHRLLRLQLEQVHDVVRNSQLRRAANEAANLARSTNFPLLLFPALFEERAAGILASPTGSVAPDPDYEMLAV